MGNSLSDKDLDMLAKKTHFNETQIKKWYRTFRRDCPSGQLNREQFLSMYNTVFPNEKGRAFYEHIFRAFDQDGSGKIDFNEFIQGISVVQSGSQQERLELSFRLYDIDGNGTINQDEITNITKERYAMAGYNPTEYGELLASRIQDIFDKLDTNKDGVLSKDEFIQGCMRDEKLYELLAYRNAMPPSK